MRYKEATTGCWPFWLGGAVVIITFGVTVMGDVRHKANYTANRASMLNLQAAMRDYLMEYHVWPEDLALANADIVPVKVRGPMLDALLGDNLRGIKFMDPPEAKPGRSPGLVMEQGVPAMHDSWGTCYYLMLDMNRDGQVKNPEHLSGAVPSPKAKPLNEFLPMLKALFSAGPDQDPNTWKDNITSWR